MGDAMGSFVDGYAVRDFLQSREALKVLSTKLDFRTIAIRPKADPLVRLPQDATEDQLFATYRSMVSVQFNMLEQIVAVKVFAFTPDDTIKLARSIIEISESFSDQMNIRAREDVVRVTETELKLAENKALEARHAVGQWRDQHAQIDPTADATLLGTLISQLEGQLSTAENDLSNIKSSSPGAPRRRSVELQVSDLRQQIAETRARLGAAQDNSSTSAHMIAEYESLKANQDFADTSLSTLRQSLADARMASMRQQKFVSVIAEPQPDKVPAYPTLIVPLLTSLVGGLALAFFGSVFLGLLRGFLFG